MDGSCSDHGAGPAQIRGSCSRSSSTNYTNVDDRESLLTPKSLQLSLSPPRFPPYNTAQRSWMLGGRPKPSDLYVTVDGVTTPTTRSGGDGSGGGDEEAHSAYHQHRHHQRRHEVLVDRFLYNGRSTRHQGGPKKTTQVISYHPHFPASRGLLSSIFSSSPSTGPLQASDSLTRLLGTVLSLETQNRFRDGGGFRSVSDGLVTATIPLAAVLNPSACLDFGRLTFGGGGGGRGCGGGDDGGNSRRKTGHNNNSDHEKKKVYLTNQVTTRKLVYGDDKMTQFMDVFFPPQSQTAKTRGMVVFVHGGAWGSGKPWFYRLCALPFLRLGLAVAIVGYRVYPIGDVHAQVRDLDMAFDMLCQEYPHLIATEGVKGRNNDLACKNKRDFIGTVMVGHSSGAHIALLWVIERIKRQMQRTEESHCQQRSSRFLDAFIGISGPYNISHHFDYEAARGVEEISPMKAANGLTREEFRKNSPAERLRDFLAQVDESDGGLVLEQFFPRSLLIHGIEDETVPFTTTSEAARVLRSCGLANKCHEHYIPQTGHQDAVVHLMLGGRVQDAIVSWLEGNQGGTNGGHRRSKL